MKAASRLVRLAAAGALCATIAGCAPSPPSTDAEVTCGLLDDYLADCDPACANSWDCEYAYDSRPLRVALLLDDCADCLAENQRWGWCSDCWVRDGRYSWSCADLLADELGVTCTWY